MIIAVSATTNILFSYCPTANYVWYIPFLIFSFSITVIVMFCLIISQVLMKQAGLRIQENVSLSDFIVLCQSGMLLTM